MLNRFKAQLHRHRTALGGLAVLLISLFVLAAFLVFFCVNGLTDWQQAASTFSPPVRPRHWGSRNS